MRDSHCTMKAPITKQLLKLGVEMCMLVRRCLKLLHTETQCVQKALFGTNKLVNDSAIACKLGIDTDDTSSIGFACN